MSDVVIVATISGVCSVIGQYLISRKKAQDAEIKAAQREQKQQDQLEDIRKWMEKTDRKLDEHNGYAKMFNEYGTDIKLIKQDVNYLKKGVK